MESFNERLRKAKWEYENNPRNITVMMYGGLEVGFDSIILICPGEYASSFVDNHEVRELAIKQGVFKSAED